MAGPLILHDNARPHIADVVTTYGWEVLPHAPYSPDMSPPKLKEPMRGQCISSLEELSTNGTQAIRNMNKIGVLDGIIMLPKRWNSLTENRVITLKDCEQKISKK